MYCNHCGAQNPDESQFCSSCGKAIAAIRTEQEKPGEGGTPAAPEPMTVNIVQRDAPVPVQIVQPKKGSGCLVAFVTLVCVVMGLVIIFTIMFFMSSSKEPATSPSASPEVELTFGEALDSTLYSQIDIEQLTIIHGTPDWDEEWVLNNTYPLTSYHYDIDGNDYDFVFYNDVLVRLLITVNNPDSNMKVPISEKALSYLAIVPRGRHGCDE